MFQNKYKTDKPIFSGCLVDTIKTKDKVLRYSPNNEFDNATKPKTLKRGKFRNIRIFASVPEMY